MFAVDKLYKLLLVKLCSSMHVSVHEFLISVNCSCKAYGRSKQQPAWAVDLLQLRPLPLQTALSR